MLGLWYTKFANTNLHPKLIVELIFPPTGFRPRISFHILTGEWHWRTPALCYSEMRNNQFLDQIFVSQTNKSSLLKTTMWALHVTTDYILGNHVHAWRWICVRIYRPCVLGNRHDAYIAASEPTYKNEELFNKEQIKSWKAPKTAQRLRAHWRTSRGLLKIICRENIYPYYSILRLYSLNKPWSAYSSGLSSIVSVHWKIVCRRLECNISVHQNKKLYLWTHSRLWWTFILRTKQRTLYILYLWEKHLWFLRFTKVS